MELSTLLYLSFLLGTAQCIISLGGNEVSQHLISAPAAGSSPQKEPKYPQSCASSSDRNSTVQLIQPQRGFGSPFPVVCDQSYEGGGWIVIQQRFNGEVNFYRGWKDYEDGFGDEEGEFWLGLKRIHELTYSKNYELHVLLEDWDGYRANAKYSRFLVAGPEEKYMLRSLGQYSGTAGDSLGSALMMKFTTLDADNDANREYNCAHAYYGAWWYENCHSSNLNGLYVKGNISDYATMMCWYHFRGHYYGLKSSRMLIREKI